MNTGELRAELARNKITNRDMAAALSISEQAFRNKINGISEFRNSEIIRIAEILHLSLDAVNLIFFAGSVN